MTPRLPPPSDPLPPPHRPLHALGNAIAAILLSAQSHLLTEDIDDAELRADLEAILANAREAKALLADLREPST